MSDWYWTRWEGKPEKCWERGSDNYQLGPIDKCCRRNSVEVVIEERPILCAAQSGLNKPSVSPEH